ncbi:putative baseplate assembly protein [Desertifilum sp. FACHB-1129]|uniref:Putative baseplate assembly protein n=1 Tax=Desertifilum tharense IPPAS B-1220 TaxID=1781255 RepID=A0A1E5QLB7_9CYAN|nr:MULTISPECIES: putative baseplate assembly protein [Desertifilum]MBD2314111.1 putative baseplate assembly protein [Desertifilum sp. FACHB-1129]MBD2323596.1 putative baseplate assembly protein [Desertifilum sp. FACHB-866]MBD2335048.1 putative baseplate assembly protein [Desertifilum sp. FACHB-868]OEJ75394.1 putative baseplate assembly protein [Desertifilum tharense IPPAS B-1220]
MEFDFLPNLPKSNLDDRTFKDLVDECILRIPRYCPEWTNYNASDPGITLIELFAWLTDQMLLRFNQVPRRNYIAFLEVLGVRLQAPTPAQTDITFYLTTTLPEPYTIPLGVEVATLRTQTDEAIVFSTDAPLTISHPSLRHFLTAQTVENEPQALRDRITGLWTQRSNGEWTGRELSLFNEQPEPGNCFYLVFNPEEQIEGNVLAVTFKGEAATPTGINPDAPPRRWEAWNGTTWQPVLIQESDDGTKGFSFSEIAQQGGNPLQGSDILLHLPTRWPVAHFTTYQGRWLRCVYTIPQTNQPGYNSSPRIISLAVRSVGGTVGASQSSLIQNELLGESDGTPGQSFQLQGFPILPRREGEYLIVTPPGGLPQAWQEVSDFASSTAEDLHYTLDSRTGIIQFGPLIREPSQLVQQTWERYPRTDGITPTQALPSASRSLQPLGPTPLGPQLERQYGAVPPRGSTLRMVGYRVGGGRRGNVQRGTLIIPKSAIPYVARVINHWPARNGADAESLEDAVLRVPAMLRTRDRAVTPEDFEALALQAGMGAVARTRCLSATERQEAGTVRLLIVPQANTDAIAMGMGIHPERFALTPQLQDRILAYLNERRLLGIQVKCIEPNYVGVSVQTEVALEPAYNNPQAQEEILFNLRVALYRFLNPLTGGSDGKGWPFGRPLYPSDIVTLFQQTPGVRYLGVVQLFEIRKQNATWVRTLPLDPVIEPGPQGLLCSWADNRLRSGHVISILS